MYWWVVQGLNL